MCLFGIIKLLRKTFRIKSQNSLPSFIYISAFNIINNQIINVEKVDNFNPNATHVYNSHYYEPRQDEEEYEEEGGEPKDGGGEPEDELQKYILNQKLAIFKDLFYICSGDYNPYKYMQKTVIDKAHEAILSSKDGFTAFSFGGYHIRFKAPYSLERYLSVVTWDDGYLVVLAKYSHNTEPEEEYIDLKPILKGLYIDTASFLKPIKSVRVAYA